ncbi:MAG: hypothetical protein INR66_03005 [Gordonia polyisoprenivorans]|nr:hypothetical protein [Gordonia polyisoprenivorans]
MNSTRYSARGRGWLLLAAGATLVFAAMATTGIIAINEVAAGSVFA